MWEPLNDNKKWNGVVYEVEINVNKLYNVNWRHCYRPGDFFIRNTTIVQLIISCEMFTITIAIGDLSPPFDLAYFKLRFELLCFGVLNHGGVCNSFNHGLLPHAHIEEKFLFWCKPLRMSWKWLVSEKYVGRIEGCQLRPDHWLKNKAKQHLHLNLISQVIPTSKFNSGLPN